MPYNGSRVQQEEQKFPLSFLARVQPMRDCHNLANEQLSTLFSKEKKLPAFISFIKSSSLHFCWELALGLPWLQTLNGNSFLIPNKLIIFAREITGSY